MGLSKFLFDTYFLPFCFHFSKTTPHVLPFVDITDWQFKYWLTGPGNLRCKIRSLNNDVTSTSTLKSAVSARNTGYVWFRQVCKHPSKKHPVLNTYHGILTRGNNGFKPIISFKIKGLFTLHRFKPVLLKRPVFVQHCVNGDKLNGWWPILFFIDTMLQKNGPFFKKKQNVWTRLKPLNMIRNIIHPEIWLVKINRPQNVCEHFRKIPALNPKTSIIYGEVFPWFPVAKKPIRWLMRKRLYSANTNWLGLHCFLFHTRILFSLKEEIILRNQINAPPKFNNIFLELCASYTKNASRM